MAPVAGRPILKFWFGKAKNKVTVPLKTWYVEADSIRKLNRTKKDQVPDTALLDAQSTDVPF